jgi:hypothetical protein
MIDILTHVQDWLRAGAHMSTSDFEWYFVFFLIVLVASMILNTMTGASELREMSGNFLTVLVGAMLGRLLVPDWSPPIEITAQYSLVLLSGMVSTGAFVIAVFKPS